MAEEKTIIHYSMWHKVLEIVRRFVSCWDYIFYINETEIPRPLHTISSDD